MFNVRLNEIDIVENLDIFGKVGRAVAHDEIIPFKVKNKKVIVNSKKSDIEEGSVSLTLVKVSNIIISSLKFFFHKHNLLL